MTGQVAGSIGTDRKPRTRKTLADKLEKLEAAALYHERKAKEFRDRASLLRNQHVNKAQAMLAEAEKAGA